MKIGLEKKERWKAYCLGGLGLVMLLVFYTTWFSGSDSPTQPTNHAATPAPVTDVSASGGAQPPPPIRRGNGRVAGDFHPKLRDNRPESRVDPTKVDPTLRLDLLATVQNVSLEGGARNIFQFGPAAPPPPTTPLPTVKKIIPGEPVAKNAAPPNLGPPPAPPAPPIPFKYYGYSSIKGEPRKRAFFLDGEDIIVAWEGEMIKNRYKVVHVGINSVEMEDVQFKNKQSLPLAEELAG